MTFPPSVFPFVDNDTDSPRGSLSGQWLETRPSRGWGSHGFLMTCSPWHSVPLIVFNELAEREISPLHGQALYSNFNSVSPNKHLTKRPLLILPLRAKVKSTQLKDTCFTLLYCISTFPVAAWAVCAMFYTGIILFSWLRSSHRNAMLKFPSFSFHDSPSSFFSFFHSFHLIGSKTRWMSLFPVHCPENETYS